MKRSNITLAAIAAIVIAVILAGSFVLHGQDDVPGDDMRTFPTEMTDADRSYTSPEEATDIFESAMRDLDSVLNDGSSLPGDVASATRNAFIAYNSLSQQRDFAHLDYCFDPSGMREEHLGWESALDDATDVFNSGIRDALNGEHSETVTDVVESFGKRTSEYLGYADLTEEQRSLTDQRSELIAAYNDIISTDYTWTDSQGRTWTFDSAYESTVLTVPEKMEVCQNIHRIQMDDATEVYIDIVRVNNDLAETYGYHCFAEMEYKVEYGREYSTADAEALFASLGPALDLRNEMFEIVDADETLSSDTLGRLAEMEGEDIIEAISPVIEDLGPEYKGYLDWMVRNGTIFLESVDGQLNLGYSTDLAVNHGSLMYVVPGRWGVPMTVTHEFGHSANAGLNMFPSTCYDVSEIHSQGLEALVMVNAERVFGEDARALVASQMLNMLTSVNMGALRSDFELWAYETEAEGTELTVDMVNSAYARLAEEHGIDVDAYGLGAGYSWQNVHHLFDVPMYYVSYVTSSMNALELFVMASEDYDGAVRTYLALTEQNGVHGYVQAVEAAGLSNMLDGRNVEALMASLGDWVEENL